MYRYFTSYFTIESVLTIKKSYDIIWGETSNDLRYNKETVLINVSFIYIQMNFNFVNASSIV